MILYINLGFNQKIYLCGTKTACASGVLRVAACCWPWAMTPEGHSPWLASMCSHVLRCFYQWLPGLNGNISQTVLHLNPIVTTNCPRSTTSKGSLTPSSYLQHQAPLSCVIFGVLWSLGTLIAQWWLVFAHSISHIPIWHQMIENRSIRWSSMGQHKKTAVNAPCSLESFIKPKVENISFP